MSFGISTAPKWFKDFKWSDLWGGIKEDVAGATKHVGTGVQSMLAGVRGILTPTIIWLAVIAIVGLIIFKKYKKVLGL